MMPIPRHDYGLTLLRGGEWREIINSDAAIYGGSNMGNGGSVVADSEGRARITLPPLATLMLEAA